MEKVVLRGHHLLCVHGFQGNGYSPAFVEKMADIVNGFRNDQIDFPIQVVRGFDETCLVCPNKGESVCEAGPESEQHVQFLDSNVFRHLGLQEGETYLKSQLVSLTKEKVKPEDLAHLCQGCSWYHYGMCTEGIAKLSKGADKKDFSEERSGENG